MRSQVSGSKQSEQLDISLSSNRNAHLNRLPNYFQIVWMKFMQPQTFRERLVACEIDDPDRFKPQATSSKGKANIRLLSFRFRVLQVLSLILIPLMGSILLDMIGFPLTISKIGMIVKFPFASITGFVSTCIVTYLIISYFISFGPEFGFTMGIFFGFSAILVFIDIKTLPNNFLLVIPDGILAAVIGILVSSTKDRFLEIKLRTILRVVGFCFFFLLICQLQVGIEKSVDWILIVSTIYLYLLFYLRLPFYLLEAPFQTFLYILSRFFKIHTLKFSPVLFHELSVLPYTFLSKHIELEIKNCPETAQRVLDACKKSLAHQWLRKKLLAKIQVKNLKT